MFNNIIYFIIALLVFSVSNSGKTAAGSFFSSVGLLLSAWLCFLLYCRMEFQRIKGRFEKGAISLEGLSPYYQRAVIRLSVFALCLFTFSVHFVGLKWWISQIFMFPKFSVLQGTAALSLFFFYLATIWYFAYPVYKLTHESEISRKSFLFSNVRLNLPIVFPWFFLSLAYDLIELFPMLNLHGFLDSSEGQIVFLAVSLGMLVVFLPIFVRYFWGCKPLETTEKVRRLKAFFKEKGFRYGNLLNWPVFEGHMMTAGIMGVIPRYRYLLVTDSLMNALSSEELEAVMAHEMGHARYRHLLFYIVFLVGFMAVLMGFFDISHYLLFAFPLLTDAISKSGTMGATLLSLLWFMPAILILLIYFRYIMGFFMRNFERQADLYSAKTIGTPLHTISSLEKIAAMSGKIRDLPSWHHFGIGERVEHLWRTLKEPDLLKRQNRLLVISFSIYFILMGGLGYFLNFSQVKQQIVLSLGEKGIKRQLLENPDNISLNENLAMIYHESGNSALAVSVFKKILELEPDHAEALNYIGYTYAEKGINLDEAMSLIKKALRLKPDSGAIIDSLGWVYFQKRKYDEALHFLEKAHKLLPRDPTINEHLGDVFFIKKDYSKALDLYKKARHLGHPKKDKLKSKISHIEMILKNSN